MEEQRASWPATAGPFRGLASVQLRAVRAVERNVAGEVTSDLRDEEVGEVTSDLRDAEVEGGEGVTLVQGAPGPLRHMPLSVSCPLHARHSSRVRHPHSRRCARLCFRRATNW